MILFLIKFFLDFVIEINLPLFKYRICHHNFDCCSYVYLVQRALQGNRGTPAFTEARRRGTYSSKLLVYVFYCVGWYWRMALGRQTSQPAPAPNLSMKYCVIISIHSPLTYSFRNTVLLSNT